MINHNHWHQLNDFVQNKIDKERAKQKSIHHFKLEKLGIQSRVQIESTYIDMRRNNIDRIEKFDNVGNIFNKSDRRLSEIEKRVLSKGLKFGIKSKKVDTYEIMARFEELAQSLNHLPIAKKEDELRENLDGKSAIFQQLQNMTTAFIEMS